MAVIGSLNGKVPDLNKRPFAASVSGLVMVVRHAQDVDAGVLDALAPDDYVPDAEVAVHGVVADEPIETATYECVLTVTAGRLDIGDADHWDTLHLPAGIWRAQVTARPVEAPDQIEIVLSPLHPPDESG